MKWMGKKKWKKAAAVILAATCIGASLCGCAGGNGSAGDGASNKDAGTSDLQAVIDSGVLIVSVSPDYAPYEFLDLETGDPVGSDIEFAKYIAEELGVKLKIEQMSFESCLASVTSGTSNLSVSCLSWTKDREDSMELSNYYNKESNKTQTVLVKKEVAGQYKTAEDFAGKKVAAQNGTTQYTYSVEQLKSAEVEPISVMGDGVMMLIQGKIDALATPLSVAKSYLENYPDLAIAEFEFKSEEEGNVVAAKKGNTELINKVNEIIKKAEAEGLFEKWMADAEELAKKQGLN